GLTSADEASQFEKFVNYSIITNRVASSFDVDDVTTGDGDDGIDGIVISIDEEVILSDEDASSIFNSDKKNHDVELIFVQSKRSENFDLGDFLKFKESILRFLTLDNGYSVNDEIQT